MFFRHFSILILPHIFSFAFFPNPTDLHCDREHCVCSETEKEWKREAQNVATHKIAEELHRLWINIFNITIDLLRCTFSVLNKEFIGPFHTTVTVNLISPFSKSKQTSKIYDFICEIKKKSKFYDKLYIHSATKFRKKKQDWYLINWLLMAHNHQPIKSHLNPACV